MIISIRSKNISPSVKGGTVGGIIMTVFLWLEYGWLFSSEPLLSGLFNNPLPLFATSVLVSIIIFSITSQWSNEYSNLWDAFVFAASPSIFPAGIAFLFMVRAGILGGFGSTIPLDLGDVVIGMFFVLLYVGFGAIVAGYIFAIIFVGSLTALLFVNVTSYGYRRLRT